MKIVSESTWSFQIIIFFILIFACFLTLIISYNKAYSVKNRMLSIVEKYEGVTPASMEIMNDYISNRGYSNTGKCSIDWMGAIDLDGNYEVAKEGNKYYYCFKKYKDDTSKLVYYDIKVFFRFNLPVIGSIANYEIDGTTKSFVGAKDAV